MPVDIQVDAELASAAAELIDNGHEALLDAIAAHVDDHRLGREVCVRICDEAESRHLNAAYRQQDKPTNVLSFAAEIDVPEAPLGDLAICLPVVLREAGVQGKAPRDHLTHLLVHGVLHLLGYDHAADAEAQLMEALEKAILADCGIADPYAGDERADD